MIKNNNLINEEYFDVLNECGEFTDEIATREECHKKGLWHRAVYGFIFNKKGDVLLQKRAKTKKIWPDLWDITAGGHVLAGEFGEQALQREIKEELNYDIIVPSNYDLVIKGLGFIRFSHATKVYINIDSKFYEIRPTIIGGNYEQD